MSILVIGLDAGEIAIIERLIGEGRLPTMASLWNQGTRGRLVSRLGLLEGMTWHRWIEGRDVSKRYHHKVWRPDTMGYALACGPEYHPRKPFWIDIAEAGGHVGAMDVHSVEPALQKNCGWVVKDWQCSSDFFQRSSHPASLIDTLLSEFGAPTMPEELYGLQTGRGLLRLREELVQATRQAGRIVSTMLARERFDLFIFMFGAIHRAGHYLWDTGQIDRSALTADELTTLDHALDEVYVETDQALARILASAPGDTTTVLFSPFGMGVNPGWTHQLPAILGRIANQDGDTTGRPTFLGHAKHLVPIQTLMSGGRFLPPHWRRRLVAQISPYLNDWSQSRFLAAPGEPHGYVRINLKGREIGGLVEPGAEFRALVDELESAIMSFVDRETGMPIVTSTTRIDDVVGFDHPDRPWLPDLVAEFTSDVTAFESSGVVSPKYGEVRWEKNTPYVSGRAGNHLQTAWYCGIGPRLPARLDNEIHDTIDLAPSIQRLSGLSPDTRLDGMEIAPLVAPRLVEPALA